MLFTVHEMKRLGGRAAELLTIAEDLCHHDIEREMLSGPLKSVYDASGCSGPSRVWRRGQARLYPREVSGGPGAGPRARPPQRPSQGRQ